MPIYEFYSSQTHKVYSFYARSVALAGKTPRCPENPDYPMERVISLFSVTRSQRNAALLKSSLPDPVGKMKRRQRLAEMGGMLAGIDESNPDPRRLACLIGKMSQLNGGKRPEVVTEIIRRLEAGEEYEKLDGDYGSAFESSDFFDAYEEECPSAHPERRRPVSLRDPTLYDMADYLEEGLFQAEGAGGQR